MNKKIKLIIIGVAALFTLNIVKNGIFQTILCGALSKAAHVRVVVGHTQVSFFRTAITLKNLRFYNPRSFPDRNLLIAPLIAIDFDPSALWKGRLHFEEVDIHLKEITVVKNRNGQLNVDAMKPSKDKRPPKETSPEEATMPPFKIDRLSLSIGRVVYKDYSQGGDPQVETFDINIQNRVYTNIDNPGALVSLIMFEALTRTTLSRLTDLDMQAFKSRASRALSGGLDFMGEGVDGVEGATQKLLNLFK